MRIEHKSLETDGEIFHLWYQGFPVYKTSLSEELDLRTRDIMG